MEAALWWLKGCICETSFGHEFAILWETDSTAAVSISERQGVGRLKHMQVRSLWLQQAVKQDGVLRRKIATLRNPADLGTKVHAADRFEFLRSLVGIKRLLDARVGGVTSAGPDSSTLSELRSVLREILNRL